MSEKEAIIFTTGCLVFITAMILGAAFWYPLVVYSYDWWMK